MFTGIVERVGRVVDLSRGASSAVLTVECGPDFVGGVCIGASVAIDGCCLTVIEVEADRLRFEAVLETLERTTLGERGVGDPVHLERALAAGGRLDGHLVQGHVDGCGVVAELVRQGADVRLLVECAPSLSRYLVPKGSVAIDGVSLTVVDTSESGFSVVLIPHTLAETHLGERSTGDRLNLEVDVIGKYVHHYMERLQLDRIRPD